MYIEYNHVECALMSYVRSGPSDHEKMVRLSRCSRATRSCDLRIVTNLTWPAFRNVAIDVQKALQPYRNSVVLDWKEAKPGGDMLFIETVRQDTLKLLRKFLSGGKVVFYGTTEGHSIIDEESIQIARKITLVAVSGFAKQMLEEVNLPVSGVVHHGLDMNAREADPSFTQLTRAKTGEKLVTLTVASNDMRKGLGNLLQAHRLVESRVPDSFLVLHSEPTGYYSLQEMATELRLQRLWLTSRHGSILPRELNSLYALCDVYILPSFSEGFGLPMLEAFRFDKPVVAVDAPPFSEVVDNGATGILVPYQKVRWSNFKNKILFKMHIYEPTYLAEAAINLLSNKRLRESLQINIKERKHLWSIHRLYPKLLDYF